jgi:hypothetical protein
VHLVFIWSFRLQEKEKEKMAVCPLRPIKPNLLKKSYHHSTGWSAQLAPH